MIDPETKRALQDLQSGRIFVTGSFDLDVSPATSTTVSRRSVSASSVILTQAYSADAQNADIVRIVPSKDEFTVYHTASASTRTHRFVFFTGI